MEETIFVMQLFQRTNTLKKEKKMSVLKKNKKKIWLIHLEENLRR